MNYGKHNNFPRSFKIHQLIVAFNPLYPIINNNVTGKRSALLVKLSVNWLAHLVIFFWQLKNGVLMRTNWRR